MNLLELLLEFFQPRVICGWRTRGGSRHSRCPHHGGRERASRAAPRGSRFWGSSKPFRLPSPVLSPLLRAAVGVLTRRGVEGLSRARRVSVVGAILGVLHEMGTSGALGVGRGFRRPGATANSL